MARRRTVKSRKPKKKPPTWKKIGKIIDAPTAPLEKLARKAGANPGYGVRFWNRARGKNKR